MRSIHQKCHRCTVHLIKHKSAARGSGQSVKQLVFFLLSIVAPSLGTPRIVADSNDTHTIVRFEIQRGTNSLGRMDVELFDQDKPETTCSLAISATTGPSGVQARTRSGSAGATTSAMPMTCLRRACRLQAGAIPARFSPVRTIRPTRTPALRTVFMA